MLDSLRSRLAQFIAPSTPRSQALSALQNWRSFDGASQGRRTKGFGRFHGINNEVAIAGATLRSRARYLAANNQYISNGVGNLVGDLVGTGIRPTSKSANAVAAWDKWNEHADADGRTTFDGIQEIIARSLVVDGEALLQFIHDESGFTCRVIPSDLLDSSLTRELDGGRIIVQGVELDAAGKRVAYHILPAQLSTFTSWAPPVRVPAEDIAHVFKPIAAGQVRGISWLAPVILPASEVDELSDALLMGCKVAAMHAGIITDLNGTGTNPFGDNPQGNVFETGVEPGTLKWVGSGLDVKWTTPPVAQQTGQFMVAQLRGLAAGLGIPDFYMSGNLEGANYSSLRAGLLPHRRRVEQVQYGVLIPQLLTPTWRRVQLLEGTPSARAEWLPTSNLNVDPKKDTESTLLEISAGLKSRRQAVAERGWSIEQLDAEIAQDRDREQSLGLSFGTQPTPEPKESDE